MSMFDRNIERLICNFGDNWGSDEHKFRASNQSSLSSNQDEVILRVRLNGQEKEYLRLPIDAWNRYIKSPVDASRVGSSYATRFFLYHWLEETNQLSKFFNSYKELQNA